jgi:hypothetical protein
MWFFKYLICLIRKHNFTIITMKTLTYRYCLRCGRSEIVPNQWPESLPGRSD